VLKTAFLVWAVNRRAILADVWGMNSFLQMLPPELQSAPALLSGFLTLLGLILCTAGIKVARPMAAGLVGAATATLAACVLPPISGMSPWLAAIIGLAAGLLIGATGFRLVQGLLLALCLSVLACNAFFQWQTKNHPLPPSKPVALQFVPDSAGAKVFAKLPETFQTQIRTAYMQWEAIPLTLRQSVVVVGLGVAVFAAVVAWMAPRQTTWMMSATVGALMMLYGVFTLLHAYVPQYARRIPAEPLPRLVILVGVVAAGMLVQRLYFWPGKRQQGERAKDRPAELAPA
jgi:hypothetical protein